MIIKLKYRFYIHKDIVKGRTKLSGKVEATFEFDTDKYWDGEDNYWNVVSDYISKELKIKEHFGLHVEKLE